VEKWKKDVREIESDEGVLIFDDTVKRNSKGLPIGGLFCIY
jgi:hypothetical protein